MKRFQDYWVAAPDYRGSRAGCGALHVLWSDLGERTVISAGR